MFAGEAASAVAGAAFAAAGAAFTVVVRGGAVE
jgi:hypothetical protein